MKQNIYFATKENNRSWYCINDATSGFRPLVKGLPSSLKRQPISPWNDQREGCLHGREGPPGRARSPGSNTPCAFIGFWVNRMKINSYNLIQTKIQLFTNINYLQS